MEHCEDGGVNTEKQQKRKKRLESQRHSSGETKKGKKKSELSKIGLQEREEKIPVSLGALPWLPAPCRKPRKNREQEVVKENTDADVP